MIRFLPRLPLALLLLLLPAAPAVGQIENLDEGQLIEKLREEQMGELLLHFVETADMDDPVLRQQVKVSQLLLDYQEQWNASEAIARQEPEEAARLRDEAAALFEQALEAQQVLIDDFYDDPRRPMWQTRLGEMLLYEYLQVIHEAADDFYEFGVPTQAQREAVESATVQAFVELTDAHLRFFELRREVPNRDDFEARFEATNLWHRMTREFDDLRTPFFLARAGWFVSQLSEDHAYYQTLRQRERMPVQARNMAAERTRIWAQIRELLEPIADDTNDSWGVRADAMALVGRAEMAMDELETSAETFSEALQLAEGTQDKTLLRFRLELLQSRIAFREEGLEVAIDHLHGLRSHPQAAENLRYRVLLVDLEHRFRLEHARSLPDEAQPEAVAGAYDPYLELFSDPELAEDAPALRQFVYRRWESSVGPETDLEKLPPVVLLAVGQVARTRGQNPAVEAFNARRQEDEARAERLMSEARPRLERAVEVLDQLLLREGLGDEVMAEAFYNKGMARFFLGMETTSGRLEAARIFLEMAERFPDHPNSRNAIGAAVNNILRTLYLNRGGRDEAIAELYKEGAELLFEKFPQSEAAANERFYYAINVLLPAGDWDAMAEVLEGVPEGHPDYFLARAGYLEAQLSRLEAMEAGEEAEALRASLREEAERVEELAELEAPSVEGEQARARLAYGQGRARLTLAELDIQAEDTEAALARLDNFEQEFALQPALVREALEARIMAYIRAERFDDAAEQARKMVEDFKHDETLVQEAVRVVRNVLSLMDEKISQLQQDAAESLVEREKTALREQADRMAEATVVLAEVLVEWAEAEELGEEAMEPFTILLGQSYRLNGACEKAIDLLRPLRHEALRDEGNVQLLHNLAEAYFACARKKDDPDLLKEEAAPHYDRLITGIQPDDSGVYPDVWWNAWSRRLRISDIAGQGTKDIPLRVRQLEMTDPDLGGEPYNSRLRALYNKYAS